MPTKEELDEASNILKKIASGDFGTGNPFPVEGCRKVLPVFDALVSFYNEMNEHRGWKPVQALKDIENICTWQDDDNSWQALEKIIRRVGEAAHEALKEHECSKCWKEDDCPAAGLVVMGRCKLFQEDGAPKRKVLVNGATREAVRRGREASYKPSI